MTILAGSNGVSGSTYGIGSAARFNSPGEMVIDSTFSTIYISESGNFDVRQLTLSTSLVSTLVGTTGQVGNDSLHFSNAWGLALLSNTLYITDSGNHTVRSTPLLSNMPQVTTLAGTGTAGAINGAANVATFNGIACVCTDGTFVYVTEQLPNHCIRKIDASGNVTTFAGSNTVPGFAEGVGTSARFNYPYGICYDPVRSNIYVCDSHNYRIRQISTVTSTVTTLAGSNANIQADGIGNAARFANPVGICIDSTSTYLYVMDNAQHIRRIEIATATVLHLAASNSFPNRNGYVDGPLSTAWFSAFSLCIDAPGTTIYVADFSFHMIRKVSLSNANLPTSVVTTFAGLCNVTGKVDGISSAARFNSPSFITIDSSGILYVLDNLNHSIRQILSNGYVTTMSGITASNTNGPMNSAQYKFVYDPLGLCIDSQANTMYIGDRGNNLIRKIVLQNIQVSTFAGNGTSALVNGPIATATFIEPYGITIDSSGTIYVSDGNYIRKISNGIVTTFAGNGLAATVDGQGSNASFNTPRNNLCTDALGNVYVGEFYGYCVRKITPGGYVTTVAGLGSTIPGQNGSYGYQDGQGTDARFYNIQGICIDSSGILYVADSSNRIRKIVNGLVSTLAGSGNPGDGTPATSDGQGIAANIYNPYGISVDSSSNLYFGDYWGTIRKIDTSSNVTTIAGVNVRGYTDGPALSARFFDAFATIVDPSGILYISDNGNAILRKLYNGYVTTLAGSNSAFQDGSGSTARFGGVWQQAFDPSGDLYIADPNNRRIRKITGLQYIPQTTLVAGSSAGFSNAAGAAAKFCNPLGITINTNIFGKNILVADSGNNVIRNIAIQNRINSPDAFLGPLASNMVTVYTGTGENEDSNMPMLTSNDLTIPQTVTLYSNSLYTVMNGGSVSAIQKINLGYPTTTFTFSNTSNIQVQNATGASVTVAVPGATVSNAVITSIPNMTDIRTLTGSGASYTVI